MLEIRTCKICGFTASLEEFPKGKRKKDGSWYRRHKCKKCYWELKKKYRANKRKVFIEYKKTLACKDCGYSEETHEDFTHTALEFHHHNEDKSYDVGNMINQSGFAWKTIKKEVEKCIVLCCRCHRERHNISYSNKEQLSECCSAKIIFHDICSLCKEHI
tara:strand:- start:58 stop:537 length:480 start_codon:yes stop_codon:yes gene_type:complete